jgi:dTDP-4-dehydrorhamnose 3,5-epimerase
MKIIETTLPGVIVIEPKVFGDDRGFFVETYRESLFQQAGITEKFIQDNHSRSSKGVLRGLHYQLDNSQGKLVRVATGCVFDVAVDVRIGSPYFGQWYGTILDEKSKRMMYVPPNFAHGFVVLSEYADFIYKCTNYYNPSSEQGILWNDSDIGIKWPTNDVSLSDKDKNNVMLKKQPDNFLPKYSTAD